MTGDPTRRIHPWRRLSVTNAAPPGRVRIDHAPRRARRRGERGRSHSISPRSSGLRSTATSAAGRGPFGGAGESLTRLPWDGAHDVRDGAVRVDRREPFAVSKLAVLTLRREAGAVRVRDAASHGQGRRRGRGADDANGMWLAVDHERGASTALGGGQARAALRPARRDLRLRLEARGAAAGAGGALGSASTGGGRCAPTKR